MWSHYADQHRGFCIEYERTPDNELGSDNCHPVKYCDDYSAIIGGLEFFKRPESVLHDVIYTKASCWAYESEWRLAFFSRELEPLQRERTIPARIRSIIFGLRASDATISTIARTLAAQQDVEFYQMKSTGHRFHLEPIRIEIVHVDTDGQIEEGHSATTPSNHPAN